MGGALPAWTRLTFLPFLTTRSSVREYTRETIHDKEITYLFDCVATAPSAGNLESWDVVMVQAPDTRKELSEAALGQPQVREDPLLLIVCANYVRSMSRYGERGILYAVQDATIACTYAMLI